MSTNAITLALLFGIIFAISDRVAVHVGDRFGRTIGSALWAVLVLAPTITLALLNVKAAGVAIVVGVVASPVLDRLIAMQSRRNADPFAQSRPSLRWLG